MKISKRFEKNENKYKQVLEKINEKDFRKPLPKEEWSAAEVIVHMMNWDLYLINKVVMEKKEKIVFPDPQKYNKLAYPIAKNLKTKKEVVENFVRTREVLITKIKEIEQSKKIKEIEVVLKKFCDYDKEWIVKIGGV